MFARLSAFVIWSLVAATAAFWLLRLTTSAPQAPAYAVAVGKSAVVRGDLTRLFGAPPTAVALAEQVPQAPSRFKLLGVMAPRSKEAQSVAGNGLALIAVDGKPPKAFAVGAPLDSGLVLQSVGMRTASIGPARGARSMLLELPALAPPNTGVLPPSGFSGSPVPMSTGATQQSGLTGMPVPPTVGSQIGSQIGSQTGSQTGSPSPGVPVLPGGAMGQSPPPQMPLPPGVLPSPSGRLPPNDSVRSQ